MLDIYTRDILIHDQGYNNSIEGYFDTGIILRSQGYFKRDILNPSHRLWGLLKWKHSASFILLLILI